MAIRVFELARELSVTSKVILDKCRAEEIELKNHMTTLSAGLEATIREWFTEGANVTAVETAEHVDLDVAREEARKARKRRGPESVSEADSTDVDASPETVEVLEANVESLEGQLDTATAEDQLAVEEEAVVEHVTPAAPAEAIAEKPQPEPTVDEAQAVEEAQSQGVQAEQALEEVTGSAEMAAAEPAAAQEAPAAEQPVAAEPAQAPKAPPAGEKPPRKEVKPAGPQLVPRPAQLKGPRVVRVEKPDFVRAPVRRPPPAGPGQLPPKGPVGPVGAPRRGKGGAPTTEEDEAAKKGKGAKRSPRRRGGRSADSGERLVEWRNQDLVERSERLAAAGGGLRRHRASVGGRSADGGARGGPVEIDEPITVKSLSAAAGLKSADIIRKLMGMGVLATINQSLDRQTAETIAAEFGLELKIKIAQTAEEELLGTFKNRPTGEMTTRAPVVTFLGHVDHGKTSLLDYIRKASIATGEAGGITQHIGAYRYDRGNSHVVFLDTPGHEAFSAMRARGANMTDVVVLVVAADDGVMPQTVEAINHAKAAKVPIVVALNKIDVPNANVNRALGQLAEHDLQPREWGGNVEVIRTSAISGEGMDTLVETLSLEAELLELKAEVDAPASGFVIEGRMDPGLGCVARLLVRNGTLKVGDIVLAGRSFGRVRQMLDDKGNAIESAGPASPVQIAGLDEVPDAGDRFYVSADMDTARSAAEDRRNRERAKELAVAPKRSLADLLGQIEAGETNELAVIIKADVQGSLEAIVGSLDKLATSEVKVNVLHAAVGGITTGDVSLAEASDAIIIGFNVVPDSSARNLAEAKGVDIRQYRVIYNIIDDMQLALEKGLAPEVREEKMGHAEVRQVFKISRLGSIAGCFVTDGVANRNAKVRIIRNNVVVEDERTLDSLKRFKDDAREVRAGMECGLKLHGYDDIKEGDVLEFYKQVEVARKL